MNIKQLSTLLLCFKERKQTTYFLLTTAQSSVYDLTQSLTWGSVSLKTDRLNQLKKLYFNSKSQTLNALIYNQESLPFLRDSLHHCAALPGCVDDLNVIRRKLNQISQGTWFNDGRVSDEVLLKIHWFHCLCEGNLEDNEKEGAGEICYDIDIFSSSVLPW